MAQRLPGKDAHAVPTSGAPTWENTHAVPMQPSTPRRRAPTLSPARQNYLFRGEGGGWRIFDPK